MIGMDSANIRDLNRIFSGDSDHKVFKMLDFTDRDGDVADPWYTGNFDATWRDCSDGCHGLFRHILVDKRFAKELAEDEENEMINNDDLGLIHDDFPRG